MIVMSWIFLVAFGFSTLHSASRMLTQTSHTRFAFMFAFFFISVAIVGTSAGVIWGGLLN